MKAKYSVLTALALALGLAVLLAASDADKPPVSLLSISSEGIVLDATPPSAAPGKYSFSLFGPGGTLASQSGMHSGKPFRVTLNAKVDPAKKPLYAVEWSINGAPPQRRSLYFLAPVLETILVAPREYLAGTTAIARVVVRDRAAGTPVAGATVSAALERDGKKRQVFSGMTDNVGVALVALAFAPADIGDHRLLISVEYSGQRDELSEPIVVKSAAKTLLTTDKPLYQPGQTIHMRALTLLRPDMKPASDAEITFEVEDSKGNKVFKAARRTDAFGAASADFVLATELNKGTYKVRAIVAGLREEKTVTVDRYVLPKFKINFSSDRTFYEPGALLQADLQIDYFFGKPVAGAALSVDCSKFDVAFDSFAKIQGKTDERGHFSWTTRLPEHFVGQPLLAGKAFVKIEIDVTDSADHTEKLTRNVTVAASPLILAAVPESGSLVPGLPNRVYVVTTYADGSPASATIRWRLDDAASWNETSSDAGGFAAIRFLPPDSAKCALRVEARDPKGNSAEGAFELSAERAGELDRILLHIDRALYSVGDPVRAEVFASVPKGTAYFDVVKDGQTYLSSVADLSDGRASFELTPDASLAGTVTLSAYIIGRTGDVVRDQRLVVVDPADELSVRIVPAQDSFLPGDTATVNVHTADRKGSGVPAALVISVVDEAVFALQEMQPGLEKIYFYLEQEIAKPRYEIHGWELTDIVKPMPLEGAVRREHAALVLLASAQGADAPRGIEVNTFNRDNKDNEYQTIASQALAANARAIAKAMENYAKVLKQSGKTMKEGYPLEELVRKGYLAKEELRDPWGGALRMTDGAWCTSCLTYHAFTLVSDGPDRVPGTADDVRFGGSGRGIERRLMRARAGGMVVMEEMAVDFAMAAPMAVKSALGVEDKGPAPEEPRVRSYFPETLLWLPSLITDASGNARFAIPLADSITTWRMTALANSRTGLLGSATGPLRVFQDFFVDVDFPVALTQNDRVWVPVAVYNYLPEKQSVRLVVTLEDWFDLDGPAEKTLDIGPGEVTGVKFPIRVKGIGNRRFTVKAFGAKMSDAVMRSVEVLPDGTETLVAVNGRLEGTQEARFAIPAGAIAGATNAHLKIYPGVFSQLVEGIDKILRMPFGCFEQTSSATYPNILVLDYMKTTGIATPELRMTAEGYINAGYQRLLSFEVPGGGFEWFGKAPAHKILTAYGLMEFYDMSAVHNVDPAVISRTQNWLVSQQEKDGSWKPAEGGIAEGAINRFTDSVLRNTAYITLALISTGCKGDATTAAEAYLVQRLDEIKDTYTLALAANTFASLSPDHKSLGPLIEKLLARRTEEADLVYWKADSETPTHGSGAVADIEVTSWAVMALVRAGQSPAVVSKAITYLVKQKDSFGTWQSTQATIVALKAMLMAQREGSQKADATIKVVMNGQAAGTIRVTPENSDVLQLLDLTSFLKADDNLCRIEFEGEGSLFYQVSGRYWMPRPALVAHREEPLSIDVAYDRTELSANDTVSATISVENRTDRGMKMVIVDVGIPPGFTPLPDGLEKLVAAKTVQKYSLTGRQIIFYLDTIAARGKVALTYSLAARFPVRAKTPKATVYQYYAPDQRADAQPVELVVLEK
ncbi:MAG: MG2 domain-containing protein [Planctomycetota bacterium]